MSTEPVVVCQLGQVPYAATWTLQQHMQEALIQAKRATPRRSPPHVLLLLEHPHTYTLGKSGQADHLLLSEAALDALGATFHHIDRGGDITYHGPGQLVGYPLFDLDRFSTDLGWYLRTLEEVVIRTCADYGVTGTRVDGRTGTWIGPDAHGPERKICAMGVRCSRWVTMHGFAFNVTTNLDYFDHIVPCGIRDRGVTSLDVEQPDAVSVDTVTPALLRHLVATFQADLTHLQGADAWAYLRNWLPQTAHASLNTLAPTHAKSS
ncbi:MAG: lipoyl(octanoyl) transferase LipB [Longimonas sp.]